jgi:Na+/H+ antiporter NhaA
MAVTSWWKLAAGAFLGALIGSYLPGIAFTMAIVVGSLLAWASLKKEDPDDPMTPLAAGYLVGVLGFGLIHLTLRLMGYPA